MRTFAALRLKGFSILGVVNSFAPARAMLQCAPSPDGPWRLTGRFRVLGQLAWQRFDFEGTARYWRLFIRREGHATFQHRVHGVVFHVS